jgi:hypothetical protein
LLTPGDLEREGVDELVAVPAALDIDVKVEEAIALLVEVEEVGAVWDPGFMRRPAIVPVEVAV